METSTTTTTTTLPHHPCTILAMSFVPDDPLVARLLRPYLNGLSRGDIRPETAWRFLRRVLACETFVTFELLEPTFANDIRYHQVQMTNADDIREAISEYVAEVKADFLYWGTPLYTK